MGLTHLNDYRMRNQALVSDRELISATPASDTHTRLQAELAANPGPMLDGLIAGDEGEFLTWAVEQLQRMAEVPFALVGELAGEDWDRVQTIELRTPAGPGDNFEYDLLGTPCSNVVGKTACIYPQDVAELFPDDVLLADMGVQSYVGLPLFDPGGRPLGLVVLLDQATWSREKMQTTLDLLVAFRPRLETVLINRRARRDLELLSEQLSGNSQGKPLDRLARAFAHAMNVSSAFVAEAQAGNEGLRTTALIDQGEAREARDYTLEGIELDGAELLINEDLAERAPTLAALVEFEAAACLIFDLLGPEGERLGQVGLIHDRPLNRSIGEQPVVQAFRRQISFELRRQLLERERAETQRRMLELQRTESLGILAGGVAHDFNNLLVGVLGNADLALLDLGDTGEAATNPGELHESLVDIRDAARAAMQLCQQMLAYAGQAKVEAKRFELGAQLDELSRLLAATIPKTTDLVIERGSDPVWVDGDMVQIRQVLMNLIVNASDATGPVRGQIRVTIDRCTISEGAATVHDVSASLSPGAYVRVRVRDNGCGMDPATLARIFDPFFTTKPEGHGLGLAAILGIIRGHGGAIEVDSTPGVGTAFAVYLPEAEAEAAPETAPEQGPARAGRVLVVDDDPRVTKVARRMLERFDYGVITAGDGLEALEIYARERDTIDCVILDLSMPKLGGAETRKRLQDLDPALPIIVCSGHAEQTVAEAVAGEARLIVHKPYELDQLIGTVGRALDPSVQ